MLCRWIPQSGGRPGAPNKHFQNAFLSWFFLPIVVVRVSNDHKNTLKTLMAPKIRCVGGFRNQGDGQGPQTNILKMHFCWLGFSLSRVLISDLFFEGWIVAPSPPNLHSFLSIILTSFSTNQCRFTKHLLINGAMSFPANVHSNHTLLFYEKIFVFWFIILSRYVRNYPLPLIWPFSSLCKQNYDNHCMLQAFFYLRAPFLISSHMHLTL